MTVAELITALARCDGDDLVLLPERGTRLSDVGRVDADHRAALERGGAVLALAPRDGLSPEALCAQMRARLALAPGSVAARGVVVLWPASRGGTNHG